MCFVKCPVFQVTLPAETDGWLFRYFPDSTATASRKTTTTVPLLRYDSITTVPLKNVYHNNRSVSRDFDPPPLNKYVNIK